MKTRMKIIQIALILILRCTAFGQGLQFPNMRWVEPSPSTGQPLLIHTSCGSPDDSGESWSHPISVYSDSDVELFVDQDCLTASAQVGFASGKYSVNVVTFYKGDAFCRMYTSVYSPADRPNPGFLKQCRSIFYRSRRLNVDTRAKAMRSEDVRLEDSGGRDLGPIIGDKDWHPISDADRDPNGHPLSASIAKITQLVQEKYAYFKGKEGKP